MVASPTFACTTYRAYYSSDVNMQDIKLAKALNAHSPAVQDEKMTATLHGVDLLLGGHDHLYYVSKGVTSWEGYDVNEEVLGGEEDHGDVLVVKSGTDFRDLSEFTLELEDTPAGSVRTKLIKKMNGKYISLFRVCLSLTGPDTRKAPLHTAQQ